MARAASADQAEPPRPLPFATQSPAFIDFGSGRGESMGLAEGLFRNPGIGVDILPERVAECQAAGWDVQQADVLTFQERNLAPVSLSVDLMPELDGLRAFETACTNMLRAARDFTMIQHLCFDSAEALLAREEVVPGHTARQVRIRPRAVDYLHFVMQAGRRLDVVGLAVFGVGEPRTVPLGVPGLSGMLINPSAGVPAFRSIRIVIARKDISRFHRAIKRVGTEHALMMLETP